MDTDLFGRRLSDEAALGVVGGGLAIGTFLATAVGTRLRIHRPVALQAAGLVVVTAVGVLATLRFSLLLVALLCLVTAVISGIAKLAVDASIQERVRERLRATAFAHSETALMLAFVAGGALGLIPVDGRVGIGVLTGIAALATVRALIVAGRLRNERLSGRAMADSDQPDGDVPDTDGPDDGRPGPDRPAPDRAGPEQPGARRPTDEDPTPVSPAPPVDPPTAGPANGGPDDGDEDPDLAPPGYHIYRPSSAVTGPGPGDEGSRRESRGP